MSLDDADDETLLAAWRRTREEYAFRTLCARHAALVGSTCRRLGSTDVDDAAQAVFMVLSRRAGSVTGLRLAGWLVGTTRRVVAHQRRAARRRRRHEQEAAVEQQRQSYPPAEATWDETRTHLDAALASLSPGRREAVVRFFLQGKPQAQVADELGCSEDAVKTRVHEGVERLRAFFSRRGVPLGVAAVIVGLASEAAAADPTLTTACTQATFTPASAPNAVALVQGMTTTMLIKTTAALATVAVILITGLTIVMPMAAEPASAPIRAAQPARNPSANAALDWWRAFEYLPDKALPLWKLANDHASRLSDPAIDELESLADLPLRHLALGAGNDYCDWGLDPATEGASALTPYLTKMRSLLRLGILRARWHAQRGHNIHAVDDLLVCLRAARLWSTSSVQVDLVLGQNHEGLVLRCVGSISLQLDPVQRRRIVNAFGALPASVSCADLIRGHQAMVEGEIMRMLTLPLNERTVRLGALIGVSELTRSNPAKMPLLLSDVSLKDFLRIYGNEMTRLETHFRSPLGERLKPLSPRYSTGDEPPHPLLPQFAPALDGLARGEIRLLVQRAQILAALAYLDHGAAGLNGHPNPLSGMPFAVEQIGSGFRLLADIPGEEKPMEFTVGANPSAADAKEPPTSDF